MTARAGETSRRSSAIRAFLIADIRGYTRFTRDLGDEAASRLAGKLSQIVGEATEAHDGRLLELRGDEAMCVFDSARAALRCAVELQHAFADEARLEPHLPLNVGIGLDAGEAVPVGDGYRGTAINLAARLCSAAAAGTVLASDGLVHLAGRMDGLTYLATAEHALKGFDEPIAAWSITADPAHGHDGDPPSAAVAPGALPAELEAIVPLVGREADLQWLAWHWRRARHGHGGFVALSGPTGMGRTRLAAEIAALAQGQGAAVRYSRGSKALELPAGPALVVIDDLDALPSVSCRELLGRVAADGADHRLVILTHRDPPSASLDRELRRLVGAERRRTLGPIGPEAVQAIARLYLERPEDDPPTQLLLEESDGVPQAVHRVASQWARGAAARRLSESARRTSRERRDLRAAEADLIGDVERLAVASERTSLYVSSPQADVDAEPAPAVSICPYKGLAAFEATDAQYYFGRERLIGELIARIVGSAFIGLVGASGSGKSSVLQAGLLPALSAGVLPGSDQWIQVAMRPGEHPMRELGRALHRSLPDQPRNRVDPATSLGAALEEMAPAQRLMLVIDHFEEVFSADADERTALIELITEQRAGMKVLVAVRADHYERCADYPRLARLLGGDQVLVGPLVSDEVAAIVRHPAERVGLRVEPELVEALIADIGTEPGALPLLSTALLELWEARDGRRLTLAAYRATGGVRGAVARLAEAAYGRLEADEQAAARAVFLRLTGEGDARTVLRRRVTLAELDVEHDPLVAAVVEKLTVARLLTVSDGYVEVAHEALIREWPRLRSWIDEDAAGRALRLHLIGSAQAWEAGGREEGDLYRGARLAATLDWATDHGIELNAMERAFLDESQAAANREADRQRRTNRNLRGLLAGAAVFLLIAIGAGAAALEAASRAEAEERRAEDQARVATARELYAASVALVERDPELAMLLALRARDLGVEPSIEAIGALHQAVQDARGIAHVQLEAAGVQPFAAAVGLSPDGSRLYAGSDSGSIGVYDVEGSELLATLGTARTEEEAYPLYLAISPDGNSVARVDGDAALHVWDAGDGEERVFQLPGYGTDEVVWSSDGTLLAAITFDRPPTEGDADAIVTVVEASTGAQRGTWTEEFMWSLAFTPDGGTLLGTACPCDDSEAVIAYDIESGERSVPVGREEAIQHSGPTAARFSPDGLLLATAGLDRKVILWDTATGATVATFAGHTEPVTNIVFSPAGDLVATTSFDGTVRVWDVERGETVLRLAGQGGTLLTAAFSADGSRLATGSSNLTARVWDLTAAHGGEVAAHELGDDYLQVKDMQAGGDAVAILGREQRAGFSVGTLGILELGTGERVDVAGQVGAAVAVSADGSLFASQADGPDLAGSPAGPVTVYDRSGDPVAELDGICPALADDAAFEGCIDPMAQTAELAFSPDGSLLAGAGFSYLTPDGLEDFGWVAVWNTEGTLLHVEPNELGHLAFAPDGRLLAFTTDLGVSVVDPLTFDEVATIDMLRPRRVAFSPDGSLMAAVGPPFDTQLFDVATWESRRQLPSRGLDLDFSDSGASLVTADADGYARHWDIETGELLQAIPIGKAGPGFSEYLVEFSGDSRILTVDSRVLLELTLDEEELFEAARQRVSRELTEHECQTYLHVDSCAEA